MKKIAKHFIMMLILLCIFSSAACTAVDGNSANNGDWSEWVLTIAPTCEVEGVEERISLSNSSIVESKPVPVEHNWDEWNLKNAPTCLVAGVETRACKNCGNSDMRTVAEIGHSWNEWENMILSCTETGAEKRICKHDSNHVDIRTSIPLGHNWTDWVVTTSPSCTVAGIETRFCINDNAHTEVRDISEYGHNWTDWVITSHPGESNDGEEIRLCKNNKNHIETLVLHAKGTPGLSYSLVNNSEYKVIGYNFKSVNVYIPNYYKNLPVTGVGSFAFAWKNELESIFIGSNVKVIGHRAFYEADMKSVTFANDSQLEIIEDYAFLCSRSLESIEIPAGIKRIEKAALSNCYKLESVTFASDGNLEYIGDSVFFNNHVLESFEVPESMTAIKDSMLGSCTALKSVTFAAPEKIISIERRAFMYCYDLVDFELPINVINIGEEAFYAAHKEFKLESIEIPAGVQKIGNEAFAWWNAKQTIYVRGFACQADADAAWGAGWRLNCYANIVYGSPKIDLFNRIFIKGKFDYTAYADFSELESIAAVIQAGRLTETLKEQYADSLVKSSSINVEYYIFATGKNGEGYNAKILYDGTILDISQIIIFNNNSDIKQITRTFKPIYNYDGQIESFYLSQEILHVDADVDIVVSYYIAPTTEDVWIVEKSDHQQITFLSRTRIMFGLNNNIYLYLYANYEGIWDIEKLWEAYKEKAVNETSADWKNIVVEF